MFKFLRKNPKKYNRNSQQIYKYTYFKHFNIPFFICIYNMITIFKCFLIYSIYNRYTLLYCIIICIFICLTTKMSCLNIGSMFIYILFLTALYINYIICDFIIFYYHSIY